MQKNLIAIPLLLIGVAGFLLWYQTSKVSELEDQVVALEATINQLQLNGGVMPERGIGMGDDAVAGNGAGTEGKGAKRGKGGKAGKAGKAGKGGKAGKTGKTGKDRGPEMLALVATFSADKGLTEETTQALETAASTLTASVKGSRPAPGSENVDATEIRKQRQEYFAVFEEQVRGLLDAEQAEALIEQIKSSRPSGPPAR
jgi:hypothetical protein